MNRVENNTGINENTFLVDEMFFNEVERKYFESRHNNIILYRVDAMPYVNYEVARSVFENVVGNNYDLKLIKAEYIESLDIFLVHVRIIIFRRGKTVSKDVLGTAKCLRYKDKVSFSNPESFPKSAMKDAFKKFLRDYMGIGLAQYYEAKRIYDKNIAEKNNRNKNNGNNNNNRTGMSGNPNQEFSPVGGYNASNLNGNSYANGNYNNLNPSPGNVDNTGYFCSDCSAKIDSKIYYFSSNIHSQKRPLCRECQEKYK